MTKMLDILEDFLTGLNIKYERIDGGKVLFNKSLACSFAHSL